MRVVDECGLYPFIAPLTEPTPSNRETEKIRRGGLHPRNRSRLYACITSLLSLASMNASPTKKCRWVFSRRVLCRRSARPKPRCGCGCTRTRVSSQSTKHWLGAQCTPMTVYNSSKSSRVLSKETSIRSNNEPALEYRTTRSNQHVNNSRSVPQKKKRITQTYTRARVLCDLSSFDQNEKPLLNC